MHRRAFTLIEVSFVIAAVGIIISMLLPARENARNNARRMENSSRVRELHKLMLIYARDHRAWYPGLTSKGMAMVTDDHFARIGMKRDGRTGADVSTRYEVLLRKDYCAPDVVISPAEKLEPWKPTDSVTRANYSYAMLRLTLADETTGKLHQHPRNRGWSDSGNTLSPVISDRNVTGDDDKDEARSIWTEKKGEWLGSVGFNDNHVVFEKSPVIDVTLYRTGQMTRNDHLFQANTADETLEYEEHEVGAHPSTTEADAKLVHNGP